MARENSSSGLQRAIKRFGTKQTHMKYWYGYQYKHAGIKEDLILLESFHGKTINDSPLACAREIDRLYPGRFKMVFATNDIKKHSSLIRDLGLNVELVDITSRRYAKVLASAKYIISNASLPTYFIRREGQRYLQTWHGTPLKTLGKQMADGIESMYNVQHNFIQATHLLFPNDFTRDVIMRDYNLERLFTGQVVMCGYPRNQIFLDADAAQNVKSRYGLTGKTVYAYMPTWRGTSNRTIENSGYFSEVRELFRTLDSRMKDDQIMYVNFHPIIGGRFSFKEFSHIRAFPGDIDNYEFLNAADALITDYSSVFFDYSLTGKPIILYTYDYDRYMRDRGMYMDINSLPFRVVTDEDELCNGISEGRFLAEDYADSEYAEEFLRYERPLNTQRLIRLFISGENDGLALIDYSGNKERSLRVYKPDSIKTREDFKTLSRCASDQDAIVLMQRKWFKGDVGKLLHKEFRDSFNFIISVGVPPRTYLRQILKNLGSSNAEREYHRDDVRCTFGDLNVDENYITDYGCLEKGYGVDKSRIVLTEATVSATGTGTVEFCYSDTEGLTPYEAVIMDNRFTIVSLRELRKEEAESRRVAIDFSKPIEDLTIYRQEYGTPGLICKDRNGDDVLVCFTDSGKASIASSAGSNGIKARAYSPSTGTFALPKDYERVHLGKVLNSPDKRKRGTISSYDMQVEPRELVLIPTLHNDRIRNTDIIRVMIATMDIAVNYISEDAELRGYRFSNSISSGVEGGRYHRSCP